MLGFSIILFSCKDDKSNPVVPPSGEISGLVAYFSFDSTVANGSSYALASTNHGCAFDTNRLGEKNKSCKFNGSNNWVEIAHNAVFDSIESRGAITLAAWVNIHAWYLNWNIFNIICQYEATSDNGWEIGYSCKPYLALGLTTSSGTGSSVRIDSLALNRWYHTAVAYDRSAGKVKFYLNGMMIAENTFNQSFADTDGEPMYIGFSPMGPDEYTDGLIDELYIFNRALSSDEITNLYQRTK
jgi:hypothetical protein